MTTQGSVDDFRYFLPRLFQGIVEEPYSYSDETLFHKLSYAKWATWPLDEQMALKRYLNALWQCSLESFPIEERLPAFFEIRDGSFLNRTNWGTSGSLPEGLDGDDH